VGLSGVFATAFAHSLKPFLQYVPGDLRHGDVLRIGGQLIEGNNRGPACCFGEPVFFKLGGDEGRDQSGDWLDASLPGLSWNLVDLDDRLSQIGGFEAEALLSSGYGVSKPVDIASFVKSCRILSHVPDYTSPEVTSSEKLCYLRLFYKTYFLPPILFLGTGIHLRKGSATEYVDGPYFLSDTQLCAQIIPY
jgi:hypothetical protein